MILVDLYEQVLDGAQEPFVGVILRVYPRSRAYGKYLDQTGLWSQIRGAAVVHIALTNPRPKTVLVACAANTPANGRAIVARCRLYRAAATHSEGDQGNEGDGRKDGWIHIGKSITLEAARTYFAPKAISSGIPSRWTVTGLGAPKRMRSPKTGLDLSITSCATRARASPKACN